MSIIKLSHTQKELFLVSPRAWFYKYKLNLKEEIMGSPLFFGSLVETGVDVLLKGGTLDESHNVFEKAMKYYNVNGRKENLITSKNVRYSKADWQEHLFTEGELEDLKNKTQQFKTHQSLIRSGKMMITEFYENIFPKIKKVIAIQEYIKIDNGVGDEIMGFADIICEWEDGRILVLDLKTSGNKYKDDALESEDKGTQTAIYYEALKDKYKLDGAGFLVLEKKVRKRDPYMRSQIIIGKPSSEIINKTYEQYDYVLQKIKEGSFPCCSPQCDRYGQDCAYKKYCNSGGTDLTGLLKYSGSK